MARSSDAGAMPRASATDVLVLALLACTVVAGVALRLQDPLSTRALAAEDPYTHVVFTKEWIDQGYFADSFHLGTSMYPPGMHAWLGAFVPFTGLSLYDVARIAPALFGGLAVLGMYALGARLAGPVAGLGAAFLTAIIPEHIFRSELLFPTAFDLALLPLWLLSFDLAVRGRSLVGRVLFVAMGVPLAIMHPWVVPLFAAPLALYAALRKLRGDLTTRELAQAAGLLVVPVAFAMSFRWDESDTGFADFLAALPGLAWLAEPTLPGPLLFVILLALLAAVAAAGVGLLALVRRVHWAVWLALGAALLASIPLMSGRPPPGVNYQEMLGPLAIALALGGFALAFVRPSALGDLGVAVCVLLYPLTVVNVFDSPYWPQRTVAYVTIGAALLGGSLVARAATLPLHFARSERARRVAAPAAVVAVALVLAGSSTALTVDTYEWYRLYEDDEFATFEEIARELEKDPDSKVFIFTWQPALLVKTLTEPEHVWYSPKFFQDAQKREDQLSKTNGAAYVLVDGFTREAADEGKAQLGFLEDGSRYRVKLESPDGSIVLYEVNA